MEPALDNNAFLIFPSFPGNFIDKAMLLSDPPRPETLKTMFQWFRLADSLERILPDGP